MFAELTEVQSATTPDLLQTSLSAFVLRRLQDRCW